MSDITKATFEMALDLYKSGVMDKETLDVFQKNYLQTVRTMYNRETLDEQLTTNWVVGYRNKESGQIDEMLVFGVSTKEEAIQEASYSLGATEKDWYVILDAIELDDRDMQ